MRTRAFLEALAAIVFLAYVWGQIDLAASSLICGKADCGLITRLLAIAGKLSKTSYLFPYHLAQSDQRSAGSDRDQCFSANLQPNSRAVDRGLPEGLNGRLRCRYHEKKHHNRRPDNRLMIVVVSEPTD
jgi:hypothetical protein